MKHPLSRERLTAKATLHDLSVIADQVLLVLSVILLVLIGWDFFVNSEFLFITEALYFILWVAFVIEFVAKLMLTKEKLAYIRKEFLVIFIIIFPFLRPFRLFPVSRWALVMLAEQLNDRFPIFRRLRILEILMLSTVLVILSADLFMLFENQEGSTFRTFGDAVWFSVVSVATVGYGDIYPQTTPGRILASILIIFGFSVFGIVTASISSYFVERNIQSGRRRERQEHLELAGEETVVEARLQKLYDKIDSLERKIDELRRP